MTYLIDIVCRNTLTGADSEFGRIQDRAVHKNLMLLLDGTRVDDKLYYAKAHENLIFAAYKKSQYVDADGKKRNIIFSSEEVDEIIDDIHQFLQAQTLEIIEYCHDIQYLIGSLNAISVLKEADKRSIEVLQKKFEEVNLISILVSAKSAFFRYLTEDTSRLRKDDVSITGKCFKIHKGIEFLARSNRKEVESSFNSNSKSTVKMVDIFEFIPFIIVENAIKYGPKHINVDFDIKEMAAGIIVEISSYGPELDVGEEVKIFERGYRGRRALEMGIEGHGMGLFQIKKAAAHLFGGDVSVRQTGTPVSISGVPYRETIFTIKVPAKR